MPTVPTASLPWLIAFSSLCLTAVAACSDGGSGTSGGASIGDDSDCSGPFCLDDDSGTSNECTASLDSTADDCSVCLAESCCDETQSFVDAEESEVYYNCMSACSADSCYEGCADDYPAAAAAFIDLAGCIDDECGSSCDSSDSSDVPVTECTDTSETDSCTICAEGYCCGELSACSADASCMSLVTCAAGCSSDACVENCVQSNSAGVDPLMDLYSCQEEQCSSSCG